MTEKAPISTSRWLLGMFQASIFSLAYIIAPPYIITAILAVIFHYPSKNAAWMYATPLALSYFSKPRAMPNFLGKYFKPMLDYFQFEQIHEISDDELRKLVLKEKKNFIVAAQPHGVISFCGICSFIDSPEDMRNFPTAVASILLSFPILKNVMGVFNLCDASSYSLKRRLRKEGVDGTFVLYIGGLAEMFQSSRKRESLYLSKRKGFIKYGLEFGVDIIPIYLFGNTSVLTVVKNGPIASISRKLKLALTFFWGKYNLPIPRDDKLLLVRGKPLGLPHIPEPTNEDIDKWHAKYCEEVVRLFDTYKGNVELYKDKTLQII